MSTNRTSKALLAAAVALLLAACGGDEQEATSASASGADAIDGGETTATTAAPAEVVPPSTTVPPTTQPPTTSPPTPTTTAAPVTISMPNITCGTNLQVAQDLVQSAGIFFSTSEDATGAGRMQVLDSNWVVIGQEPAAGTLVGEAEATFYVVKTAEFSGCAGAVPDTSGDGALGDIGNGSASRLATLHDRCAANDLDACSDLFWESPSGSAEEAFAQERMYG